MSLPILTFDVGDQRCALPLSDVREVLRAVAVTRLPDAPARVAGVINVRGALVPVMNVRERLGLPPRAVEPSDHLILARAGERTVAIGVDRANWILEVDETAIESAGDLSASAGYVSGVAKLPDGLVLIHDLQRFLSPDEERALTEALDAFDGGKEPVQ